MKNGREKRISPAEMRGPLEDEMSDDRTNEVMTDESFKWFKDEYLPRQRGVQYTLKLHMQGADWIESFVATVEADRKKIVKLTKDFEWWDKVIARIVEAVYDGNVAQDEWDVDGLVKDVQSAYDNKLELEKKQDARAAGFAEGIEAAAKVTESTEWHVNDITEDKSTIFKMASALIRDEIRALIEVGGEDKGVVAIEEAWKIIETYVYYRIFRDYKNGHGFPSPMGIRCVLISENMKPGQMVEAWAETAPESIFRAVQSAKQMERDNDEADAHDA